MNGGDRWTGLAAHQDHVDRDSPPREGPPSRAREAVRRVPTVVRRPDGRRVGAVPAGERGRRPRLRAQGALRPGPDGDRAAARHGRGPGRGGRPEGPPVREAEACGARPAGRLAYGPRLAGDERPGLAPPHGVERGRRADRRRPGRRRRQPVGRAAGCPADSVAGKARRRPARRRRRSRPRPPAPPARPARPRASPPGSGRSPGPRPRAGRRGRTPSGCPRRRR